MNFEPKIIAFLCNWCTYTAADAAGVARMEQPANVDVIRVMCTGRIEPMFVLKAFAEGADGVIVSGCHPPGDCHYTNGNFKTFRRMPLLERVLSQFGIEDGRFHWGWISGAEAPKWAELSRNVYRTGTRSGTTQLEGPAREQGGLTWRRN